jgi:adenylate kinase
MTAPNVLILGPPGAGKGTQSGRIAEAYDIEHITTGGALRSNRDMDISDLDAEYDTPGEYMERGELVPDVVVNRIVEEALASADGYILDGYPRNLDQADTLADMTTLDVILQLDVDREELVDRLTGRRVCDDCGANYHVEFDQPETAGVCDECGGDLIQRDDDTEETVRERLDVYDENTAPVIEFYADRTAFARVDGNDAPDAVWERVQAAIDERTAQRAD